MATKEIKEKIKKEIRAQKKTKIIKEDITFINKMSSYCITKDLHIATIYILCKVNHIEQMLDTMYETTIKEYNLHKPTIERIINGMKEEVNKKLEPLKMKLRV